MSLHPQKCKKKKSNHKFTSENNKKIKKIVLGFSNGRLKLGHTAQSAHGSAVAA